MVQGLFIRRISRRLAEVEVSGNTFEAYISNGIEMDFLKNELILLYNTSYWEEVEFLVKTRSN